jgi:hypothetical protein
MPFTEALSYGPPYSAAFSECPTTAVLSCSLPTCYFLLRPSLLCCFLKCPTTAVLSCGPPYLLLCLTALLTLLLSLNALLLLSFPAALPTCYFLLRPSLLCCFLECPTTAVLSYGPPYSAASYSFCPFLRPSLLCCSLLRPCLLCCFL